ncbi:MAG: metallophosphoesterase [Thermoleophilia bacterium]|nr:metallophosphoesterase [Thermoleophilia bacterium]
MTFLSPVRSSPVKLILIVVAYTMIPVSLVAAVLLAGRQEPPDSVRLANLAVGKVGLDSATLVFKSDANLLTVEFGPASGDFSEPAGLKRISGTLGADGLFRYEVRLDGLSPSSSIRYRITDNAGSVIVENSFRTARNPGESYSYGVISDGHGASLTVEPPPAVFGRMMEQMAAEDLDLAFHAGDFTIICRGRPGYPDDTLGQIEDKYNAFFEVGMEFTASTPLYAVAGNHEEIGYKPGKTAFEQQFAMPENQGPDSVKFAEEYYSFDNGDTHFIVLCSDCWEDGYKKQVGPKQMEWLEDDLQRVDSEDRSAGRQRWKVVVIHKPLFRNNLVPEIDNRDRLHELFASYGIDVVFQGHAHYYSRHYRDGVYYVTSGGGGGNTLFPPDCGSEAYPGDVTACTSQFIKVDQAPRLMTVSSIQCDGGMETVQGKCEGALLDSFTLTKSG